MSSSGSNSHESSQLSGTEACPCDVLIYVQNQPHWVDMAVKSLSLGKATPSSYRYFFVDDGSDEYTRQMLAKSAQQFPSARIMRREQSIGFERAIAEALQETSSPSIFIMHSQYLVTRNTIEKLMRHLQHGERIGVIVPLSNDFPGIGLEILPGHSYVDMDGVLEKQLPGAAFPINETNPYCFMISRPCLQAIRSLERSHSWCDHLGAGAVEEGFHLLLAGDSYAFNVAPQSAPQSRETHPDALDALKHIVQKISDPALSNHSVHHDVLFFLSGLRQEIGGHHTVVDICNDMILHNMSANIVVWDTVLYNECKLFNPIRIDGLHEVLHGEFRGKIYVATYWATAFSVYVASVRNRARYAYFIQGYEVCFLQGVLYGEVEGTYFFPGFLITTSHWLQRKIEERFHVPTRLLNIGFNEHIFHMVNPKDLPDKPLPLRITLVLRHDPNKSANILMDLIRILADANEGNYRIQVVVIGPPFQMPLFAHVELHQGIFSRTDLAAILQNSDVFIDTSLQEGFGLLPLEAMACGCAVVVSDSGGVNQFVQDGVNGFVVREVNKPESYADKITVLHQDRELLRYMQQQASSTSLTYSHERTLPEFRKAFSEIIQSPAEENKTTAALTMNFVRLYEHDRNQIAGVEEKNRQLTQHIAEVEGKNRQLTQHVAEMEEKNRQLTNHIKGLEEQNRQLAQYVAQLQKDFQMVTESEALRIGRIVVKIVKSPVLLFRFLTKKP